MRNEVLDLLKLGKLPDSNVADPIFLEKFQVMLGRIIPPVTESEARAMAELFGSDDCYGIAWSLLHLIETSVKSDWSSAASSAGSEWIDRIVRRRAI